MMASVDPLWGGFGDAPKFPSESNLLLLLQKLENSGDPKLLEFLNLTLDSMARGGINDQVGGGFHRYSTDANWLVPHFEKMLYNQGLLAQVYLRAYRLTGNIQQRRVAEQTLDYALSELHSPEGGFYAATDADSDGGEGHYFTWTSSEIAKALEPDQVKLAAHLYGISQPGNFEDRSILHRPASTQESAELLHLTAAALDNLIDEIRAKMLAHRQQRLAPERDNKVLTSWNAMMISALALAGQYLDNPRYRQAALNGGELFWNRFRDNRGRLLRGRIQGSLSGDGVMEDYSFLALAFTQLYDLSAETLWLDRAQALTRQLFKHFLDPFDGGLYMSSSEEQLIMVRPRELQDGATPAGSAVALDLLSRLIQRCETALYLDKQTALIKVLSPGVRQRPEAHPYLLAAMDRRLQGETESPLYTAMGKVRISGQIEASTLIRIQLDLGSDFSIDAQPIQLNLLGDDWRIGPLSHPDQVNQEPLGSEAMLEQDVKSVVFTCPIIAWPSIRPEIRLLTLEIELQLCDHHRCQPNKTIRMNLPVPLELWRNKQDSQKQRK
jgi:hypothetical protein